MRHTSRLVSAGTIPLLLAALTAPGASAVDRESTEETGQLMLVLDASGSMSEPARGNQTRIEAARQSLTAVVDSLTDDQPVGMRVFGANATAEDSPEACTDSDQVVDIDTDNDDALRAAIEDYEPVGWTPTSHALREAAKDLGSEGRRTIVLVSDGEPTCDPDPCDVAEELAQDGIDLTIDVVGLDVSGEAKSTLQCVANRGNGTYYDADGADTLTDALVKTSTRSARPFEIIGQPVSGADSPSDAPTIGPGDWVDRIGLPEGAEPQLVQNHYRVERTVPGSTIYFSATVRRPANEKLDEFLSVQSRLDGAECELNSQTGPPNRLTNSSVVVGPGTSREACRSADAIEFSVQRGLSDGDSNHARIEAPVEIRVIEEPPAENIAELPETLTEPDESELEVETSPSEIIGGSSFADAPTLADGSYAGAIVPGEAQVFFTDVDWGQNLRAQLDLPELSESQLALMNRTTATLVPEILSPARATVRAGSRNVVQVTRARATTATLTSHPVVYRHRASPASASVRAASMSGLHAVVLYLDPDDFDESVEIPFVLTTAVEGDVQGVPSYSEPVPTAAPNQENTAPDDSAQATSADGDEGTAFLPITLAALGVLLLAGAAIVFVRSRRVKTPSS